MLCPKCQHQQNDHNNICERCDIVFAKYYLYHPEQVDTASAKQHKQADVIPKQSYFFRIEKNIPASLWLAYCFLLLFLAIWSWRLMSPPIASNAVGLSFMHLVNLPFHEAGHILFRPFGEFMTSLGGTLGQILMPAVCFWVLLFKTRDPFGAAVALWWIGESFLDIAPYINDASAGQLPLLGGNFGHSAPYGVHDWEYLLTETGLLQYDHGIAKLAFFIGSVIIITALFWQAYILYKQYNLRAQT